MFTIDGILHFSRDVEFLYLVFSIHCWTGETEKLVYSFMHT